MADITIFDFLQGGNTALLIFLLLKITKIGTTLCDLKKRCPAMDTEKPCPKGGAVNAMEKR